MEKAAAAADLLSLENWLGHFRAITVKKLLEVQYDKKGRTNGRTTSCFMDSILSNWLVLLFW